jgi:hypothetical protein
MTQLFIAGTVIGIFVGVGLGLIPLITGLKKGQLGLAIGGFFACIIAGGILGLILGIPTAGVFWFIIKKAENKSKDFKN